MERAEALKKAQQSGNKILEKLLKDSYSTSCIVETAQTKPRNSWRCTPLHQACFTGNLAEVKKLLQEGADISAVDVEGRLPIRLATDNGHYEIIKLMREYSKVSASEVLRQYMNRPKVSFANGEAFGLPINTKNKGWLSDQEHVGLMIVDDTDSRPTVCIPEHGAFGVLHPDNYVEWVVQGETFRELYVPGGKFQFFYGLPELGTNLVWKPADSNPSLSLNFYHKSKEFMQNLVVITRWKKDGKYCIGTLKTPTEILQVFGNSINKVFPNTEVLSLRNICGEGISLTHEEWDFLVNELVFFPPELSHFLLAGRPSDLSPLLEVLLRDFIVWLLCNHPLSGKLRLCNKIISILQKSAPEVHKAIVLEAANLQIRIEAAYENLYHQLLHGIDIKIVTAKILEFQPLEIITNQVSLTGIPKWCKITGDGFVDEAVVAQLLMSSAEMIDWSPSQATAVSIKYDEINEAQLRIVNKLTQVFLAEFKPTYDDFLAKGYIKVAERLKGVFHEILTQHFTEKRVLVAPIKDLRRCKAKLNEIKAECQSKNPIDPPPYASRILDYLRGTVLCESIEEMVQTLEQLSKLFKITRVKPRINPGITGNKTILVNLIVEDRTVKPLKYNWSGWWDNQVVRMIGEVQITIEKMFYLDKQAHATYEIRRTNKTTEWEYQQGYEKVEQELFPMSPLHNNPLCLL